MIKTEEIADTMLRRRAARTRYVKFCEFLFPDEPPEEHHKLVCNALDDVIEGVLRRLMIFMPPGSAKSTYGSVRFPPYYLGRFPRKSIICGSQGVDLATTFGRKVRNIVDSKEYGFLFKTRLSEDSRAKGNWETSDGGVYLAAGVGSNIQGRRADLGLIDDPVGSREDADSESSRERTWNWYLGDFIPRLKPNNAQVIIQTRWHADDLSGRILPDDWNGESGIFTGFDGQPWTVICMPAEARDNDILGRSIGDWLWTNWFDEKFWEETRKIQTSKDMRNWNALYQQMPQPDTGVFFLREWFESCRYRVGDEPERLNMYGASDYAVTDNAGDFTEHGIGGFDKHKDLWFTDWWSGQVSPDKWIIEQMRLVTKHRPFAWVAEAGVIRRSVEPFLDEAIRKNPTGLRMEWIPRIGDKAANARAFQAMASQGRVHIPYTEWGEELINQLVKFIPNTNYKDDKVDVCGEFGRILDSSFAPGEIIEEEPEVYDGYGFDDEEEHSWMLA